ncbi:MAG TPA: PAS domain S-box protein [Pontibacter sp.]
MKTLEQPHPCVLKAFEKVPDLYLILSPDLTILTASDAYLEATFTVRDEIAGRQVFDVFPDNPMAKAAYGVKNLKDSLEQVLATKQPHRMAVLQYDVPLPDSQGGGFTEKYWLSLNTPVLDEKGRIQYIIHKTEDTTAQVKAEQEKDESRELLKTTMDSSLDMIQVFEAVRNEAGEIIDFRWILNNRTSEEIYGNVLGKSLLEKNPGVVGVGIFDTFKRVVETGVPDQTERHYVHEQFDGWFYQSTVKLGDGVATTTRDITSRKKAEQELRATKESLQVSQERLQLVLANTASSIMLLKPVLDSLGNISDFEYIYTNDQLLKSVNREFLLGKRLAEEFPGVKQTELFQRYKQVATEGGSWNGETHINFNGFDVWTQVYATNVKGSLLVTYFGITERKKAEQELLLSKTLLQEVIDAPNIGMSVYKAIRNEKGAIVDFVHEYINRPSKAMLGEDFTGKLFTEHGENALLQMQQFTDVVETGKGNEYIREAAFRGHKVWFSITNTPLPGDRLVHTWEDVTERKKAEQEILLLKDEVAQKATDKYQALFNSIDDGFVILEMIFDDTGKPVDFIYRENNPAFIKHVGNDLRGKRRSELSLDKKDFLLEKYAFVISTGQPVHFEYNVQKLGGKWFEATAVRIGEEGSKHLGVIFRNITERKRLEIQLKENYEQIQLATKAAKAGWGYRDFLTGEGYWDEAGQKIIGFASEPESHTMEGWEKRVHPEDLPRVEAQMAACLEEDKPFDLEYRVIRADGETRYIQGMGTFTKDKEGKLLKAGGLVMDITERKQAEAALRESEEKFRTLSNTAPALIWFNDINGENRFINQQFVDYTGMTVDEINGAGWHTIVHPDEQEAYVADYLSAVHEKRAWNNQCRIRRYDGEWRWFDNHAQPLFGTDGVYLGHVGVTVDIHDRRQVEEALKLSELKYRTLFENMEEAFCIMELVRDEQGDVIDVIYREVNKAFERHTGLTNVVGKRSTETIPNQDPNRFKFYQHLSETGETTLDEVYITDVKKWLRLYRMRLGEPGSNLLAAVFDDITERKQRELHQQFLLKFSDALRTGIDADDIVNQALQMLAEQLHLDRCHVGVYNLEKDWCDFPYQVGNEQVPPMPKGGLPLSGFPDALRIASDETLIICDFQNTKGLTETDKRSFKALGFGAALIATVREGEGKPLWSIAAVSATPRHWTQLEIQLVEEVTERTWTAVERAKAEEALRNSEEKYRTLFDSMENGVSTLELVFDENGRVVDYIFVEHNPAMTRQTGLTSDTIGKRVSEVTPGLEAYWFEAFERVVKTGVPEQHEYYITALNSWFDIYTTRVADSTNRKVVCIYNNITERKQREREQEYLLKLADALRPLSDAIEIQRTAMRVLGEQLQVDRVLYAEVDDNGETYSISANYVRGAYPQLLGRFPTSDFGAASKGLRTGEAFAIENMTSDERLSETEREAFIAHDVYASIGVPLIKAGLWVANLGIQHGQARQWTEEDIALVKETAERTWAAVERAKAEEALAKSEEKYRSLFDSIDEGYCIIQMIYDDAGKATDFRYLQVNQAFERNTGLQNAEGKTIRALVPDIELKWMEIYDQVAKTGEPLRFEESSEALHHIFSLYAFRIGEPAEYKVAVIFSDITKHKKAQAALQQSEEQFRLFVTASSDIIYKMDADWSRMHMLTGKNFLADTQTPTSSWIDVYIPETDKLLVKATIQEAISTKHVFKLEHRVNKVDGSMGWVSSRAVPVMDEDGAVKEWFGTASDITLRKQAEQQLQDLNVTLEQQVAERTRELIESKDLLQSVFDTTLIGISILKAVRDEQGNILDFRIELINKQLERETGRKDLVGKLYATEYPGIKAAGLLDIMLQVMQTGQPQGLEYFYPYDGFHKWFSCMFVRLQDGLIATNLDITEQKNAERENLEIKLKQQKELLIAILAAQEEERSRISESLHNGVAQLLYATKLSIDEIAERLPKTDVLRAVKLLSDAISETRRVSHELVPVTLKDFGLRQAMLEVCHILKARVYD